MVLDTVGELGFFGDGMRGSGFRLGDKWRLGCWVDDGVICI